MTDVEVAGDEDVATQEGVERGRAGQALDVRAIAALLFEGTVLVGAVVGSAYREIAAGTPTDPIALALRVLALALAARLIVACVHLWPSLRAAARASGTTLAIEPDRLVLRVDGRERIVLRDELLGVAQIDSERGKHGGEGPVVLVTMPKNGEALLSLPPVFERPASLAERLMRWSGVKDGLPRDRLPRPSELPSKQYDEAAKGEAPPGCARVPLGFGFLRRGPFAAALLGLAILDTWARAEGHAWGALPSDVPLFLAAILLITPIGWIALARRSVAPRKGLASLITPAEVLFRTQGGVLRAPFAKIARVHVERTIGWSLLDGAYPVKTLVLERTGDDAIRCDGAYVDAPLEAVATLCESYLRGVPQARLDLGPEA